MSARVRINRYRRGGFVGAVEVQTGAFPGALRAVARGATKAQALRRAASLAERVASDPVMRAIMPAQALAAITAAKNLAAAAQDGPKSLASAIDNLSSPAAARLATVLARETLARSQRGAMPEDEDEDEDDLADVGAWWNPITHTKKTFSVLKKLSPTHRIAKKLLKLRKRSKGGGDEGDEGDEGEGDDVEGVDIEGVGFIPLVMLAAKYGPDIAKKAKALYEARKKAKAAAAAARAAQAQAAEAAQDATPEAREAEAHAEDEGGIQ
jgi:hypothetical protein